VYEDSDKEDMDSSEVLQYLWNGKVPQSRSAKCFIHARNLDMLDPSLEESCSSSRKRSYYLSPIVTADADCQVSSFSLQVLFFD
jgi:hypothetical protein